MNDWGQCRSLTERSLTAINFAFPEKSWEELVAMPIGGRDQYLLAMYEICFGDSIAGVSDCPRCDEEIELTIPVGQVRSADAAFEPATISVNEGQYQVRCRLPDSSNLLAIAPSQDLEEARRSLIEHCIVSSTYKKKTISAHRLPAYVLKAVADRILQEDQQAEMLLEVHCPACNHAWEIHFDISYYFWNSLTKSAGALLWEVHVLAKAYGWKEGEILAMNAWRRHQYLKQVNA
ncbi:MAG: hypothetical protein IIA59_09275 [Candidatus Marinimicrobia bacterium]|nr:hypothetical protein [Candidatus Neomarinimicrobiota bacterium]